MVRNIVHKLHCIHYTCNIIELLKFQFGETVSEQEIYKFLNKYIYIYIKYLFPRSYIYRNFSQIDKTIWRSRAKIKEINFSFAFLSRIKLSHFRPIVEMLLNRDQLHGQSRDEDNDVVSYATRDAARRFARARTSEARQ